MGFKAGARIVILFLIASVMISCGGAPRSSQNALAAKAAVLITTSVLPEAQVSTPYGAQLLAEGGVAPYDWQLASGQLPPGVAFRAADGAILGTPSQDGDYSFTVQVTDATLLHAAKTLRVKVGKGNGNGNGNGGGSGSTGSQLQITTTSLPSGTDGSTYSAPLAATGGTTPYTWAVASGQLPPGLTLAASTGVVSGTPAASGDYSFTAEVKDSSSTSSTKQLNVSVSTTQTAGVTLDQFGGVANVSCPDTSKTDWNMQKMTIGGKVHWVFCTPLGHPFVKRGVYYIAGDTGTDPTYVPKSFNNTIAAKYPAGTAWDSAYARLKSWGFNAGGPGSYRHATDSEIQAANKEPFTEYVGWYTINKCINSNTLGISPNCKNIWNLLWPLSHPYDTNSGRNILDSYDPTWSAVLAADYAADTSLAKYKNSPYFIGGVLGESDQWSTSGAGVDFATDPAGRAWGHTVWYIAQSAPRIMVNPRNSWAVYSDPTNFTKQDFATWLQSRYSTIAALNAAWGSSYTTFGSTGSEVTGKALSGSGTSWNGTLSRTTAVDRFSVLVKADGVAVGGDDGFGNLHGPNIASGTVNYSTGAISVTLVNSANGVTISYWHDGWGVGTGVMDEAGTHAWYPTEDKYLTGGTATLKADFEDYLARYWANTLGAAAQAFHKIAPTKLFFGLTNMGGFRSPGRCGALKGAAQVLDVVQLGGWDGSQSQADFIGKCMGDKPFMLWYSITANPDSDWYANTISNPGTTDVSSQAARASYYQKDMTNYWNTCNSSTGVCSWVGFDWWAYLSKSFWEKRNFGLVSWRDNAYDGHEDVTGTVACSSPTSNVSCGGELKNYGNFLGPATLTNHQIDSNLTTQ